MMRRLAIALGSLAIAALPAARRLWGEAMRAELDHIADDRSAMIHAGGCLLAAIEARGRDFETRFATGMSSIAIATGVFAFLYIRCAWRGMCAVLGGPDGFLDLLLDDRVAAPALVARYLAARPIVVACLFGLGAAHLAAAYFLHRWRLRPFFAACWIALAIAVTAVAIQLSIVWTLDGVPSEFLALLVQAASLPMLLHWSNGRHRLLRRVRCTRE